MFSKGMTAFVSKHLELNTMTFEELEFEFDFSTLFKVNEHDLSRIDYMHALITCHALWGSSYHPRLIDNSFKSKTKYVNYNFTVS